MTPQRTHLLELVAAASTAFEAARAALHDAVRRALDEGATWSEIGDVLGVSRQAAFQRFGPKQAREGLATEHFDDRVDGRAEERL